MKVRLIMQALRSDDCILISKEGEDFDYKCCCTDYMFSELCLKLMRYIPDWCYKWKKAKERKEKKTKEADEAN